MKRIITVITLIILVTSAGWIRSGIDRDIQQIYLARYLNKAYFLKIPVPSREQKIYVQPGGYNVVSEPSLRPVFTLGEKVRIVDIDFGGRHIRFRITSLDGGRKSDIRFIFPSNLDPVFSEKQDFNAVLMKLFTLGLSPNDVEKARNEYLADSYKAFVREESTLSKLSAQEIHDIVLRNNPEGVALNRNVSNLQTRLKNQAADISRYQKENARIQSELSELQQNKMILQSAGRDYKDRITLLESTHNSLQSQCNHLKDQRKAVIRSLRGTFTELGLETPPSDASAEKLLKTLATGYLQLSAANRSYRTRILELQTELEQKRQTLQDLSTKVKNLTAELELTRKTIKDLTQRLDILTGQDKALAKQLLQLKQQKNVIESKLLSQNLLTVGIERNKKEGRQEIVANVSFKDMDLGSIVVSAPIKIDPSQLTKLSLQSYMHSADSLKNSQNPEIALLLKHLKHFPDFQVKVEQRNRHFELRPVQSPERENTNLWIWEATPKAKEDLDVVFRLISRIEDEPLPIFDIPLSVTYPTVEKKLAEFFQPLPTGLGIIIGLVIALPLILILRRSSRQSKTPPDDPRSGSMHFDNKEL